MSIDYDPYKETARAVPLVVIWTIIIVGLCLAIGVVGYGWQHFAVNQETSITRGSNQYLTSTQQHLVSLEADYQDLDTKIAQQSSNPANASVIDGERGQQRTILVQMRQQIATIQPEQVPPDVAAFMAKH